MDPVKHNILEEALSEFAQYGFKGTRIEAITERTHTSKRMIYYHFGSKEGLYKAVLEYAYHMVRDGNTLSDRIKDLEPLEALAMYAEHAFENFCKFPNFIRLSLQENLQGAKFLKDLPSVAKLNQDGLDALKQILRNGQKQGVIRKDITAMNVYVNFVGLCHYHISARNNYNAIFNFDFAEKKNQASRKAAICDLIVRYVKV